MQPVDFWKAWKANFTDWLDSHYKLSWEMSSEEWSQGVIEPYLLYLARDRLGLWIRFAQVSRTGAFLFDTDSSTPLAHIDHENERDDVLEKLPSLYDSEPELKCVITYGDPKGGDPAENLRQNRELMVNWNQGVLSPILLRLLSRKPEQKWLLIFGLEYDFRKESDWMAFYYSSSGGKTSILELE